MWCSTPVWILSFDAVIPTRKYAYCIIQGADICLTSGCKWNAAHFSCDSPNTARRVARDVRNVCMVGETRRPPSRHVSMRTTAMHDMGTPRPLSACIYRTTDLACYRVLQDRYFQPLNVSFRLSPTSQVENPARASTTPYLQRMVNLGLSW